MLSRFSSRAIFPGLRVISQPHIHNILKDSTHATLPEMPQYKEGEQVRYKPVGGGYSLANILVVSQSSRLTVRILNRARVQYF
jgi:hypothetical protein